MNILYIAHRIPYPPDKGDKIRSFHQICHLSARHTVHLACLIDDQQDLQHVKTLEKYCASVDAVYRDRTIARFLAALAVLTNQPLSVASFYSKELEEKIARRLRSEEFDRILVFSSAMACYVRDVSHVPKIMDFVDVDSEKWRLYADYHPFPLSWLYRLEANRLAQYERHLVKIFDRSLFVSEKEADVLKQSVNARRMSVIPNGVDLNYFAPNENNSSSSSQPAIVFTGSMDYFPNVDAVRYFCKEIFPIIKEAVPETQFHIVGRNPTRQVSALGHQPGVIVTGAVPDVRPYLGRATLAVAPFRIARGVQNKVLEAMAMGLPVVGTSVAFQGIQATTVDGVRFADDPEAFAREVTSLLQDQNLYLQCSLRARNYVERHHKWQDQGTRLESLLEEIEQHRSSVFGHPSTVDAD